LKLVGAACENIFPRWSIASDWLRRWLWRRVDMMAAVADVGMPRVSSGISTPAAAALLAASGPATPSIAPWPNSSGCLESFFSV
jgi:hypothetical protein